MTAAELLDTLRNLGVDLWHNRDQLRYRAKQGILTDELLEQLVEHKIKIIRILRNEIPSSSMPERNGSKLIRQSKTMIWYQNAPGMNLRHFPALDCSFPIEVVKPGDPATCTVCGANYRRLPFPALMDICLECQPLSVRRKLDGLEPKPKDDPESRNSSECYVCGERKWWRKNESGPWVCKVCHPPA